MSELPYCSVLLPDQYATHCHHCQRPFEVPVPCLECTQPRYCSDGCRAESWDVYHRHECSGGLDLLNSVGVAHLALRVVLVCGAGRLREVRPFVDKRSLTLSRSSTVGGDYGRVLGLVEHSKSATPEDLFQYTLTAVLLSTFLRQRTKFFSDGGAADDEEEEDVFVSALLLKHILQLVCNASAIFEVRPPYKESLGTSEEEDDASKVQQEVRYVVSMLSLSFNVKTDDFLSDPGLQRIPAEDCHGSVSLRQHDESLLRPHRHHQFCRLPHRRQGHQGSLRWRRSL